MAEKQGLHPDPRQGQWGPQGGYVVSQPPPPYGGNYVQQSTVLVTQPQPLQPVYTTAPNDLTLSAILVTLFCFWPTGILAIIRASESKEAYARGDHITGLEKYNSARQMIKISLIAGISVAVIAIACIVIFYVVIFSNVS